MSQKYPEGAVIVKGDEKRKVLGHSGLVVFLSCQNDFEELSAYNCCTEKKLESEGWTVEEAPWVPKEGESFSYLSGHGANIITSDFKAGEIYDTLLACGNCYEPNSQALKDAQARVLKAYRG